MVDNLKHDYEKLVSRLLSLDREIISLEDSLDRSPFIKLKDRLAIQQRFEAIELEKAEIKKSITDQTALKEPKIKN